MSTSISGISVSPVYYRNIIKEIKNEKKIMAIKILREASGLGLKESKDAIDKWIEDNLPKEKDNSPEW